MSFIEFCQVLSTGDTYYPTLEFLSSLLNVFQLIVLSVSSRQTDKESDYLLNIMMRLAAKEFDTLVEMK